MSFRGFRASAATAMLAMGMMAAPSGAQIQVTQTIDTTAGNGANANTGDGGPGIAAEVSNGIHLMASDRQGNVYFADDGATATNGHVVRRIDARTGVITTIAGSYGVKCASATTACGDGGPATAALLNSPYAVAVDAYGNVYIADTSDNRIREINAASGIITTVVGTGATTATTCTGHTDNYGDGCQAGQASVYSPRALAFDPSGNLYIADVDDRLIRVVPMTNGVAGTISVYAGAVGGTSCAGSAVCGDGGPAASATFNSITGLAFDAAGNLYVTDVGNFRVRMILAAGSHTISTIAGTGTAWATGGSTGDPGPGTSANLGMPFGIAVDSAGNVYFDDVSTELVQELPNLSPGASPTFGPMVIFAGGGPSSSSSQDGSVPSAVFFHYVVGISIDPFNYVGLTNANSLRVRDIAVAPLFQETNVAATVGTKLTFDGLVGPRPTA